MKTLIVRKVNESQASWHGLTMNHKIVSIEGEPWFPIHKIAGVNSKNRFFDEHNIGLRVCGSLGTAKVAVIDIEKTKKLLSK